MVTDEADDQTLPQKKKAKMTPESVSQKQGNIQIENGGAPEDAVPMSVSGVGFTPNENDNTQGNTVSTNKLLIKTQMLDFNLEPQQPAELNVLVRITTKAITASGMVIVLTTPMSALYHLILTPQMHPILPALPLQEWFWVPWPLTSIPRTNYPL